MANGDLAAMRERRMDPTGEQMTQAGRICGIIGTVLLVLQLVWVGFVMLMVFASMAAQNGNF
jgi:hypothetical protein